MAGIYLETCALVLRAEAAIPTPTPRATHCSGLIAGLLAAPPGAVAISPVGMAEFRSVIATKLQDTSSPEAIACDDAWFARVLSALMKEVAVGQIIVCEQPAKAIEQAIVLVDLAAREHGRRFRVWDAVHVVTATAWASEVGAPVEFWTCDNDFQSFVDLYPHFARMITLRSVNP